MTIGEGETFAPSRYNFAFADGAAEDVRIALYNSGSGALIMLSGPHAEELASQLLNASTQLDAECFEPALLEELRAGAFLIAPDCDEVAVIRARFQRAREETPIVITLTTTMDCNLGCYYCYEERSGARLDSKDIAPIIELIGKRLAESRSRAVHVDWYGGEPLLNLSFIEAASLKIQRFCADRGARYVASIISNGTVWPDDVEDFIARHNIRQVQISFDGLQHHHDKRRRYRKAYKRNEEPQPSSFERTVALVNRLVTCVRVDLRFNTDHGNSGDFLPFIEFARARGWFSAPHPAVFQPARLAAYSETSAFMRGSQLSLAEFDALRAQARHQLAGEAKIEESETPDGFPYPKTSVCAALANNSAVVGADKLLYRCGLQVGEKGRAVSTLDQNASSPVGEDGKWWSSFDPTRLPTCSVCSFLPICWGGCPKKHLERDELAIREQGRYWRTNLPRLIAQRAAFDGDVSYAEIPQSLQFRVSEAKACVD